MAKKPETTFSKGVNRHLPGEVYAEKTNNPFRGGIPDYYYEGNCGILWAEYKYWTTVPALIVVEKIVTPRQWVWLERSYKNGINVCIIVGYKQGGRVFRLNETPLLGGHFKEDLVPKADLATWIQDQVYDKNKLVISE